MAGDRWHDGRGVVAGSGQPLRQEAWRHDGHHCVGFVDCQPEWLEA